MKTRADKTGDIDKLTDAYRDGYHDGISVCEGDVMECLIKWLDDEIKHRENAVLDRTQGYHDAYMETLQKIEEIRENMKKEKSNDRG